MKEDVLVDSTSKIMENKKIEKLEHDIANITGTDNKSLLSIVEKRIEIVENQIARYKKNIANTTRGNEKISREKELLENREKYLRELNKEKEMRRKLIDDEEKKKSASTKDEKVTQKNASTKDENISLKSIEDQSIKLRQERKRLEEEVKKLKEHIGDDESGYEDYESKISEEQAIIDSTESTQKKKEKAEAKIDEYANAWSNALKRIYENNVQIYERESRLKEIQEKLEELHKLSETIKQKNKPKHKSKDKKKADNANLKKVKPEEPKLVDNLKDNKSANSIAEPKGTSNENNKLPIAASAIKDIPWYKKFGNAVKNMFAKIKSFFEKNKNVKNKANDINKKSGRWGRKLSSGKDAIHNKKYVPNKTTTKKRILRGVTTALAASSIFLSVGPATQMKKPREDVDEGLNYSDTLRPDDGKMKNQNPISYIQVDEDTKKLGVEKTIKQIEKDEEEKIKEFKEDSVKIYMNRFSIGSKPEVGDLLDYYKETPEENGNIGFFKDHPNYKIGHINVVTNKGVTTIRDSGENLNDILAKYPDYTDYSIHFVESENNGWLGFVNKSHLDSLIEKKVDSVIESKGIQTNSKKSQIPDFEYGDL